MCSLINSNNDNVDVCVKDQIHVCTKHLRSKHNKPITYILNLVEFAIIFFNEFKVVLNDTFLSHSYLQPLLSLKDSV